MILIRLTLKAPARVRSGEPVPLVFEVRNTGKAAVTLSLLGRVPTADFRVFDRRRRQIWSRLQGETLMGPLRLYPLDAGAALSFRETWSQRDDAGGRVAPGEYRIRAVLLTDQPGGMASEDVRLVITAS